MSDEKKGPAPLSDGRGAHEGSHHVPDLAPAEPKIKAAWWLTLDQDRCEVRSVMPPGDIRAVRVKLIELPDGGLIEEAENNSHHGPLGKRWQLVEHRSLGVRIWQRPYLEGGGHD
jgi:hypothetical protein